MSQGKSWAEKVEEAVRDAVHAIPGIDKIPEIEYCEAVLEGTDLFTAGVQMRLEELEGDDEDDLGLDDDLDDQEDDEE